MPSSISRFIGLDSPLSLIPNHKPRIFKPVLKTRFLKNKEHAWNLDDESSRNLSMSKNLKTTTFVRHSNVNPPPDAPLPAGSPSGGSLRNWILGLVITFILPFITHKWGPLLLLKQRVDQKLEMTDKVVESIEHVAERVDKVLDSITDELPKNSKLKKALESADEFAEGVAKGAHVADEVIHKVEEAEDTLESLIRHENSKGIELPKEDKERGDHEITLQQESDKNIK